MTFPPVFDDRLLRAEEIDADFMEAVVEVGAMLMTQMPGNGGTAALTEAEIGRIIVLETLNPIFASQLLASDIPEPEPYVGGLLYPETVLVVGGLVKARKTWLCIQIALSAVAGVDFLCHKIPRKRRVLYIGGEGSDRTIHKRLILAVGYIPGLQDGDLDNFGVVSSQGRVKLDIPAGEAWLNRVSEGYDIIIIDPYYRFLSFGSENLHEDQRIIQDVLDRLKAKGKAVIIAHHLRKPQGMDAGAAELRGAGLDAFADSILILSRKKTPLSERFTLRYILRHDEEPDDLPLIPNGPLLRMADSLPPKIKGPDIVDVIKRAGGEIGARDLKKAIRKKTKASKHDADEAVSAAIGNELIDWKPRPGRGQGRLYFVKEVAG